MTRSLAAGAVWLSFPVPPKGSVWQIMQTGSSSSPFAGVALGACRAGPSLAPVMAALSSSSSLSETPSIIIMNWAALACMAPIAASRFASIAALFTSSSELWVLSELAAARAAHAGDRLATWSISQAIQCLSSWELAPWMSSMTCSRQGWVTPTLGARPIKASMALETESPPPTEATSSRTNCSNCATSSLCAPNWPLSSCTSYITSVSSCSTLLYTESEHCRVHSATPP
mmetsp:Transcript_30739/g.67901  ORF Transcript_30739/g.67901 Transcript_30739/m.67901 type:complete len:230 (-) Transcript_30739:119-808(-)